MMVTIPTDSERSLISGRNGCYPIQAIQADDYSGGSQGMVFIDGVGRRGTVIKGGFIVTRAAFSELCKQWLAQGGDV